MVQKQKLLQQLFQAVIEFDRCLGVQSRPLSNFTAHLRDVWRPDLVDGERNPRTPASVLSSSVKTKQMRCMGVRVLPPKSAISTSHCPLMRKQSRRNCTPANPDCFSSCNWATSRPGLCSSSLNRKQWRRTPHI